MMRSSPPIWGLLVTISEILGSKSCRSGSTDARYQSLLWFMFAVSSFDAVGRHLLPIWRGKKIAKFSKVPLHSVTKNSWIESAYVPTFGAGSRRKRQRNLLVR